MIAWHYTTEAKFDSIKSSGVLLPASIGVVPPELPVIWFSTHSLYEPTALKGIQDEATGVVRQSTLDEMLSLGNLYRLGHPVKGLTHGENIRKAAKMRLQDWKRLINGAKQIGGNPLHWYGYVGELPLSALTVEVMDSSKKWRSG